MTKSRGIRVKRGSRQRWVEENQGRYICRCGCGEPIELQPIHHQKGVPDFKLGHNSRTERRHNPKIELPVLPCQCGCGMYAGPGKRYRSGHNSKGRAFSAETRELLAARKRGVLNPQAGKTPANFIGRWSTVNGYVYVWAPDHPMATQQNMIFEHRLVMERHLLATDPTSEYLTEIDGQLVLSPEYDVHHEDRVRDHNVVENLTVVTPTEHAELHHEDRMRGRGLA